MTVGQSQRTIGKHDLLKKITGRESGVAWKQGWRYLMIDLCAGDGLPSAESGTSSPLIMIKHREFARTRWNRGKDVRVVLIERDVDAMSPLVRHRPSADLYRLADARSIAAEIEPMWDNDTAVFVFNDPNNVHQWALSEDWMKRLPPLTTTMSTLGCNASGIKRLPADKRKQWFEQLRSVTDTLVEDQDALLIALRNDSDQWAYLLTGPKRWRTEYLADVNKAFGVGVETAWLSDLPAFRDLANRLFLTKKEYQWPDGGLF